MHAGLFLATAYYAVSIWRLRCEGFGCTGIGIAWAAWTAGLFAPSLALGMFLATRPPPRGALTRASRWLLWSQLALGAGLAATWAAWRIRTQ